MVSLIGLMFILWPWFNSFICSYLSRGQPPDHILRLAKNTSKFFKCVGSIHRLEHDELYVGGRSAYQMQSEEEYEAVSNHISIYVMLMLWHWIFFLLYFFLNIWFFLSEGIEKTSSREEAFQLREAWRHCHKLPPSKKLARWRYLKRLAVLFWFVIE